jgi:8-oxo-dGTP diphosphatase
MPKHERKIQMDFYVYVDTVVLTVNPDREIAPKDRLEVLVMRRPDASSNRWALPGGAVKEGEPLEDTALRKVHEETGISLRHKDLHQVGAYGDPGRDSRWRAFSIAYLALLPHPGAIAPIKHSVEARFMPYRQLQASRVLEFDHHRIIADARARAFSMLEDTPIAVSFCQPKFTMSDLRMVYEAFLQDEVDAANFRRKVELTKNFVQPLGVMSSDQPTPGRPPMLYRAGRAKEITPPIRFRSSPRKD